MPATAYEDLIRMARNLRAASEVSPMNKGEVAASTALAVLHLCDGNVLLKVGSLARRLGVDLHTLTRGFQALKYPSPPKEMQLRIRSEAARHMLRDDRDRKIDSIASELGYQNLGAFSKFFQKQNGISPFEFRKTHAKEPPVDDAQFG